LAEVAAYIDAHCHLFDENGHRLVVRNGYHDERRVVTAAGAVGVKAPRVNDKRMNPDTGERCRRCWLQAGKGASINAAAKASGINYRTPRRIVEAAAHRPR